MTISGSIAEDLPIDLDGVTFNIHRDVYMDINRFKVGDMVETAEGNVGLVLSQEDCDRQGFMKYQVMIEGGKYLYAALELYPLEKK